jgi:hypothetical protein
VAPDGRENAIHDLVAPRRRKLAVMLANESGQAEKRSGFFLVVRTHPSVAELMAECPKCGAMTTYGLELAWRAGSVTCSECALSMKLTKRDLDGFRQQLVDARVRIDRLMGDRDHPR